MYHDSMKQILFLTLNNGEEPVYKWLKSLDKSYKNKVINRLAKIEEQGYFGNHKYLRDDISELKFDFGKGYRIYYSEIDSVIILLVNAGDKKQQSKDIETAIKYLKQWRQSHGKEM